MAEAMISLVLPIFISVGIGMYCKSKTLLIPSSIADIKNLVTTFFLPMLAFRMFSTAQLGGTTFLLVAITFALLVLALLLGFASSKVLGEYGAYGRFLMSSAEGGMIGVGLFQMLYGTKALSYLAPIELGQGLFYFIVYLTALTSKCQSSATIQTTVAQRAANTVKAILKTPVFDGCLIGIIYQVCGLSGLISRIGADDLLHGCIDIFTALIMPLILIAIGYELSFSREIWIPVIKTVVLRCCILGACTLLGIWIFQLIGIEEQAYYIALAFEFSLPPAFLIVVYVKDKEHQRYLNASLSFYVLVTLLFAMGFQMLFKVT